MSARQSQTGRHDGPSRGAKASRSVRVNEAGAETRRRLLDSAERLFATHGLDAVSIRDITEAAGANTAAIHYHFGNKQDLIEAIVERRAGAIGRRRSELLADLEERSEFELRDVVRVMVLPTAEMATDQTGGRYYVAFLATIGDHPEVTPTLVHAYDEYTHRLLPLLATVTPGLPDEVRLLRWSIAGDLVNRLLGYPTGQVRHWLDQLRPGADANITTSLTDVVVGNLHGPRDQASTQAAQDGEPSSSHLIRRLPSLKQPLE